MPINVNYQPGFQQAGLEAYRIGAKGAAIEERRRQQEIAMRMAELRQRYELARSGQIQQGRMAQFDNRSRMGMAKFMQGNRLAEQRQQQAYASEQSDIDFGRQKELAKQQEDVILRRMKETDKYQGRRDVNLYGQEKERDTAKHGRSLEVIEKNARTQEEQATFGAELQEWQNRESLWKQVQSQSQRLVDPGVFKRIQKELTAVEEQKKAGYWNGNKGEYQQARSAVLEDVGNLAGKENFHPEGSMAGDQFTVGINRYMRGQDGKPIPLGIDTSLPATQIQEEISKGIWEADINGQKYIVSLDRTTGRQTLLPIDDGEAAAMEAAQSLADSVMNGMETEFNESAEANYETAMQQHVIQLDAARDDPELLMALQESPPRRDVFSWTPEAIAEADRRVDTRYDLVRRMRERMNPSSGQSQNSPGAVTPGNEQPVDTQRQGIESRLQQFRAFVDQGGELSPQQRQEVDLLLNQLDQIRLGTPPPAEPTPAEQAQQQIDEEGYPWPGASGRSLSDFLGLAFPGLVG